MIELKGFSINFANKSLLTDVSASFPSASLTAVIGRNGSGKSTAMKTICGLNPKYDGTILIDGRDLKNISALEMAKKLSYVNTQRPRMSNLKCRDVVALGRSPYTGWNGRLSPKDKDTIDMAFEMVKMSDYKNRDFNSLSDGESQKIMIARAIAQSTDIIILDEPTSFLDFPTRYELVNLLKDLARQGKTVVFSTHELDLALNLSDNVALVDSGKIKVMTAAEMKDGNYLKEIFNMPKI